MHSVRLARLFPSQVVCASDDQMRGLFRLCRLSRRVCSLASRLSTPPRRFLVLATVLISL